MESLEFNKIAGGVLGTLLFVVALNIVTEGMFSREAPKKPGYDLPEAKSEEGGAKAAAEKKEPLPVLLAKADAGRGKNDTGVCRTCHNFEEGAGIKIGPDLYGVVGRDKGSFPGFEYSAGMKAKGGKWTFEDLDTFITGPAAFVQGTKMQFGGEADPNKRADIIVYLDALSKTPVPLPKPEAAAAKGEPAKGEAKPPAAANAEKPQPTKTAEPAGKAPEPPKQATPKQAAAPAAAAPATPAAPAAAAGDADFKALLAKADPAKGKSDTTICAVCHSFEKGAAAKIGPNLWGVVGRDKGSFPSFQYSPGMKGKGGKWTPEDINTFITNPAAFVSGTKMAFPGESDTKKRADIIGYLGTLK